MPLNAQALYDFELLEYKMAKQKACVNSPSSGACVKVDDFREAECKKKAADGYYLKDFGERQEM